MAAKKAGASASTYYRWVNEDYVFAQAARESLANGLQHISDVAESKVVSGIFNGDKTFIIFWLKNRHKNYADKQHHIHQIPDEHPLTEERKQQIAEAMMAWGEVDPNEDECDEDYEISFIDGEKPKKASQKSQGTESKKKPKKAVLKKTAGSYGTSQKKK